MLDEWSTGIRSLGKLPNVFCKISGAPPEPWTNAEIEPFVQEVITAFGFERVVFAGNWFVVEKPSTFVHWAKAVDNMLVSNTSVTSTKKAQLLARTAQQAYAPPLMAT